MKNLYTLIATLFLLTGCIEYGDTEMSFTKSESGGWSNSGTLIAMQPRESTAVQLQAVFEQSGNYTVQFSVDRKTFAGVVVNPTAEIIWSCEGNSVRRVVSVVNGLSVSGMGQACKVTIYDATPGTFVFPGVEYVVAAQVVPGVRASNQQPPTFAPIIAGYPGIGSIMLSAGSSVVVDIPQNIGAISTYITAGASPVPVVLTEANLQVVQFDALGIFLKMVDPREMAWVPLAPSAIHLFFSNRHPTQNILFSLAYGIDG
jgi:hypothetical protein